VRIFTDGPLWLRLIRAFGVSCHEEWIDGICRVPSSEFLETEIRQIKALAAGEPVVAHFRFATAPFEGLR
jgi:hypothetical protein